MNITDTEYPQDSVVGCLDYIEALQAERPSGKAAVSEHKRKLIAAYVAYNRLVKDKRFCTSLAEPCKKSTRQVPVAAPKGMLF